ncbi:hypothetical protein [Sphingobacterium multivorum]|uniref:hypothetical protein n=1 Tax=Sphingobacterium multivorum TaxID=28454 RepID=UPI0028AB7128|nr:hypothetical protein [Sphingobacterium multivorum]
MKSNYDRVTDINNRKGILLYFSTILTLLLTINEKYGIILSDNSFYVYIQLIVAINLVLIVSYIVFDFRATYIFSRAERTRTLQYLDNSFDTNFAGRKIDNYFTQDKLAPGFYKLSVNCFENVFHTVSIIREMQTKVYLKAFFVFVIFVFSAVVGDKGIIRSIIEAILPLTILQDAIKLSLFISRLENLLDNFKTFFSSIKSQEFLNKEPEALRYVIEYETTLAWASIPLDSKTFFKHRDSLAKEWDLLKEEYNIEV